MHQEKMASAWLLKGHSADDGVAHVQGVDICGAEVDGLFWRGGEATRPN